MIVRLSIVTLLIAIFALSFAMVVRRPPRVANENQQASCIAGTGEDCNSPSG